jgi:hypothetical protein
LTINATFTIDTARPAGADPRASAGGRRGLVQWNEGRDGPLSGALMRRLIGICAIAAFVFAGCGSDRGYRADPVPTVTVGEAMVSAGDLADCQLEQELSFAVATLSRSFTCPNDTRMTVSLVFHETETDAIKNQTDGYGSLQGAQALIGKAVAVRPADQSSLKVTDASGQFGQIGAQQEAVYCASYTGLGGDPRVTDYYGSFRQGKVVVQYTSWAAGGGSCDGPSRAMENARALATKQLEKLRAALP